MQFENINDFVAFHKANVKDQQRLGQRFCNTFIKGAWPELFYETDEAVALFKIDLWLVDNCYFNAMPLPINKE
jgi:hypothetical protein